ncbi:protein NRT1/ PTR FAMILY 8.3-like [Melia azedarach]|uniref:Protein NRT1/ PTR FAMILY 8.3-like n=1 Tax=Melia azedarach TaxID=155640 RepID=A0ACC1XIQ3_MELAZ|nr:protein NRT1/ PTR FAMILY 8.3-like [Melia azedarach]
MDFEEEEQSLLQDGIIQSRHSELYTGDGSVDINGKPILKPKTGNWKACAFILGTECCERLAYYGIAYNLVSYLTNKLHEGNVSAARNVTNWKGTCFLTPLIGAIIADAYWGKYWTIAAFSTIYFIGMCTLTLSASIPALKPVECEGSFDDTDPRERVKKGSFFNWFYFCINIGALISSSILVWIQENAGWGLGFGIPSLFMGIAIISFFSATPLYRFQRPGGSPITRICQVLVASFRKWNLEVPRDSSLLYETQGKISAIEGSRKIEHSDVI